MTHYISCPDGRRLAVSYYGNSNHSPVIFFHGGGQTRHAWHKAASNLSEHGYYCLTVDFRGHGDSDRADNYRMQHFANDVDIVVAQCSSKPIVVGASLGGLSSLLANVRATTEISRALILVDIAPRQNPKGIKRILGFMGSYPNGFANLEEALSAVRAYQPQRAQSATAEGLKKNLRQKEDGRWHWHWDPAMLTDFQRGYEESNNRPLAEYQAALAKLTQPVLLVRGQHSDVVDDEVLTEFREWIPHAEVADVAQAGHMVAGDQNTVFFSVIEDFIRRHCVA